MHGARHVEGEIHKPGARGLGDELVAEEFIEPRHAELHGPVRRKVRADIEADIGLRGELRVVAAHALRRDRQIADLRRAVAGGGAAAKLPSLVQPVEDAGFRRVVEKIPLDRGIGRHGGAAGKAEDRVHRGNGGRFHSGGDITDPIGRQTDLFAKPAAPVDVMPAIIKRRQ